MLIVMALLVFSSCQKKEENLVLVDDNEFVHAKNTVMRTWDDDDGGPDYDCVAPPSTCLPDVIISPIIDDGFDVIETEVNADIISFFDNNKEELSEYMSIVTINKLIDGTFTVKAKGPNTNGDKFMLFFDEIGKMKEVRPFVK